MTKIAIIGAGPSGLLLSLYLTHHSDLLSRHVAVTVFESEASHDVQDRSNPDRSYTIDITGHGLKAIRTLGDSLENRFDKELIPFRGIHAYAINKTLPYAEKGWTGSRGDICTSLLHELESRQSDSCELIDVQLNWNSTVASVNPKSGAIEWEHAEGKESASFDLIIGADGGGSLLRHCLQENGLLTTHKKSIPNYSRILHLDSGEAESTLEPSLLHSFSLNPWAVGGAILDVSGGVFAIDQSKARKQFYVQMGYSDDQAFENSEIAEKMLNGIKLNKSDIAHNINQKSVPLRHYVSDSELQSFAARPVYHTGKTVKCSTLAIEKCALIGDAATAFPPVGQGVNAALEGATVLGKALLQSLGQQPATSLSSSLRQYSQQWLPQANACADIANTVVYGSFLSRTKLLLQGAIAELTSIDIAAAQIAKHSKYSYVEAKRKSIYRNGMVIFAGLLFLAAPFFFLF